jgi:hypothetical protein
MTNKSGADAGIDRPLSQPSEPNEYADIPSITLQRIRDEINDELGRRVARAMKRFEESVALNRPYQQQADFNSGETK